MRAAFSLIALLALAAATPVRAQIVNGGFETGTFSGFQRSGFLQRPGSGISRPPTAESYVGYAAPNQPVADSNAVVDVQAENFDGLAFEGPPITAVEGEFFAFLSNQTAAGDETLTGSLLQQVFFVPEDAVSLDLMVRVLSNEPPVLFDTFNDFAGVALRSGRSILTQFNVAHDPESGADAFLTPNAEVGGFRNSTGWLPVSFALTPYRGQTLELLAYVANNGDENNSVETRLLLDDLRITAAPVAAVVPEGGTAGLLAAVAPATLLSVAAWKRRRLAGR